MAVTHNDIGASAILVACICIGVGMYVARIIKNAHAIAEGMPNLRRWDWAVRPVIFAPPPQLNQKAQIVLRTELHEVVVTPILDKGENGALFHVRLADRTFFELMFHGKALSAVRYCDPRTKTWVATLGIVLLWVHPHEYAELERFCLRCADEVSQWSMTGTNKAGVRDR